MWVSRDSAPRTSRHTATHVWAGAPARNPAHRTPHHTATSHCNTTVQHHTATPACTQASKRHPAHRTPQHNATQLCNTTLHRQTAPSPVDWSTCTRSCSPHSTPHCPTTLQHHTTTTHYDTCLRWSACARSCSPHSMTMCTYSSPTS